MSKGITIDILNSYQNTFPWTKFWTVFLQPDVQQMQLEDGMLEAVTVDKAAFENSSWNQVYLVMSGSLALGYYYFSRKGMCWKEMHAGFRKNLSITNSGKIKKLTALWVIQKEWEAGTKKLSAIIPEINAPARHLAVSCGMRREGLISTSFLRNGQLYDHIIYGMEAPGCQV